MAGQGRTRVLECAVVMCDHASQPELPPRKGQLPVGRAGLELGKSQLVGRAAHRVARPSATMSKPNRAASRVQRIQGKLQARPARALTSSASALRWPRCSMRPDAPPRDIPTDRIQLICHYSALHSRPKAAIFQAYTWATRRRRRRRPRTPVAGWRRRLRPLGGLSCSRVAAPSAAPLCWRCPRCTRQRRFPWPFKRPGTPLHARKKKGQA